VDLRQFPAAIVMKTRQILASLRSGNSYWQLGGKRLIQARHLIRIPVTRRYRLLCVDNGETIVPLKVLSHEDYNPLIRHPKRLLSMPGSRG
jgi:hypothetical protein